MIRHLIFTAIFTSFFTLCHGQIEIGIKAGLHTPEITDDILNPLSPGGDELGVSLLESDYGMHLGLYTKANFLGIFVEPTILFNSTPVNYRIESGSENGPTSLSGQETLYHIDIPAMVGFKLFLFNVYAGPVAHIMLENRSDIIDIDGYAEQFSLATYGYQAGLGLDLWKLRFRVSYEGNLSRLGDQINIGGQLFSLDERDSRLLFTLGIKL